jgi:hypothetical protein
MFNTDKRTVRNRISQHRFTVPVLQSPYEQGYRKPRQFEQMDTEQALAEYAEVNRCINEIEHKKSIYNAQERPLIAYALELKRRFKL